MNAPRLLLAASLLGLICSACSTTPEYSYTVVDPATYQRSRTFALLPIPEYPDNPGALGVIGRADLLLDVLRARLIERGFRPAVAGPPDVMVGLRAEFHPDEPPDFSSRQIPEIQRPDWHVEPLRRNEIDRPSPDRFTLVIDVFDRESKHLLLQGHAEVGDRAFFEKERNTVQAIDEILIRFGARQRAAHHQAP